MNILCKLGFHKADEVRYVRVYHQKRKHRWHTNRAVCKRCGKLLHRISFRRDKSDGKV